MPVFCISPNSSITSVMGNINTMMGNILPYDGKHHTLLRHNLWWETFYPTMVVFIKPAFGHGLQYAEFLLTDFI